MMDQEREESNGNSPVESDESLEQFTMGNDEKYSQQCSQDDEPKKEKQKDKKEESDERQTDEAGISSNEKVENEDVSNEVEKIDQQHGDSASMTFSDCAERPGDLDALKRQQSLGTRPKKQPETPEKEDERMWEYCFVEQVGMERFECPICTDILCNPYSPPCGHPCCRSCWREQFRRSNERGVTACSVCRKDLEQNQLKPDQRIHREIRGLTVRCKNAPTCEYENELRDVEEHVRTTCENEVEPCIYEPDGCSYKAQRKDMNSHYQNKIAYHERLRRKKLVELSEQNKKLREEVSSLQKEVKEIKTAKCQAAENCEHQIEQMKNFLSTSTTNQAIRRLRHKVDIPSHDSNIYVNVRSARLIVAGNCIIGLQNNTKKAVTFLYINGENFERSTPYTFPHSSSRDTVYTFSGCQFDGNCWLMFGREDLIGGVPKKNIYLAKISDSGDVTYTEKEVFLRDVVGASFSTTGELMIVDGDFNLDLRVPQQGNCENPWKYSENVRYYQLKGESLDSREDFRIFMCYDRRLNRIVYNLSNSGLKAVRDNVVGCILSVAEYGDIVKVAVSDTGFFWLLTNYHLPNGQFNRRLIVLDRTGTKVTEFPETFFAVRDDECILKFAICGDRLVVMGGVESENDQYFFKVYDGVYSFF